MRTVESFEAHGHHFAEAAELLKDTPLFYETEQFICVHAGLVSDKVSEITEDICLWDRSVNEGEYKGKLGIGGHTPHETPAVCPSRTTRSSLSRREDLSALIRAACLDGN